MKILNIGSLNIDDVYQLPHFLHPGETLHATACRRYPGGKGLNQSIALARAGAKVTHAGAIGNDGEFLRETLRAENVNTKPLLIHPTEPTGHAVICVTPNGENAILLHAGANFTLTPDHFKNFLKPLHAGDALLLQNEISNLYHLLHLAHEKGLRVTLNPAPFNAELLHAPLHLLDTLILNEIEACQLAELPLDTAPRDAFSALQQKFPDTTLILTRQLKEKIIEIFVDNNEFDSLMVHIMSFGFKYGIPGECDLVFDVRFLPNPFYDKILRPQTGLDSSVRDYVMVHEVSRQFMESITSLLKFLMPHYVTEGKNQLVIGIGCTGGRHRSVALAYELHQSIKQAKHSAILSHRDIGKDSDRGHE
jgi:ribokinase